MDQAAAVVKAVAEAEIVQGLLSDGQPFTLTQLLRAFQATTKLPPFGRLFAAGCVVLSSDVGVKKPSQTLFTTAAEAFARQVLDPSQVLYVSNRWPDDINSRQTNGVPHRVVCRRQEQPPSVCGTIADFRPAPRPTVDGTDSDSQLA